MTNRFGPPMENAALGYVPERRTSDCERLDRVAPPLPPTQHGARRCLTCDGEGWVYVTHYGEHVAPVRRQAGVAYVVRRCPACRQAVDGGAAVR